MSAVLAPLACHHCGLPVPAGASWRVTIDGQARPMCCPGCEAVAHSIVDAGFADYYRNRSAFSANAAECDLVPPQLALYDSDPALAQPAAGQADCSAVFSLEGIRCGACVWLIERRLARLPGMGAVQVNVATERLHARWDPALCKPSAIIAALRATGYVAYPHDAARQGAQRDKARKTLFRQLFVAGLAMMQVMMYALPAYIADDGTMDTDMAALMRWASLLLTLPVLVYSAQPFLKGAWASLRQRTLGMDVPVVLGIVAASVASIVATVRGAGEVYFDSVTMFVFLLLASRYLELHARQKAGQALERLHNGLPASARQLTDYPRTRESAMVAAAGLDAGDLVMVAPGESVPADGVIVEGDARLDLALLTGESLAQARASGDEAPGGAINAGQAFVLRVTRAVRDSTLSRLVALVEGASLGKPQLAQWADRVAAWFVLALLVFTAVVFALWQHIDPARAWQVAIAVLVVSCPCALSLATPSALAAATDALVRRGILVVRPHVLETLHRATHIVFDKTGTLTEGKPVVVAVTLLRALDAQRCRQIGAALEAGSAHPLASAIRAACSGPVPSALALHSEAGKGVSGTIDGVRYQLGSASFVCLEAGADTPDPGVTCVYLAAEGVPLARFEIADRLRPEAGAVVDYFRQRGKQVVLLSGDAREVAASVGAQLGIGTALGGQLPADKLDYVRRLQQQGARVAMVGDGINDAAVLGAADVSFAMGEGAALAQLHADCVLMSGRLASLREAAEVGARTLGVVRQNLAWATLYNAFAIPAAALGLINPWVSAVGMSASSALVVMNALRLRRQGV
ncbi:heavy metal translocating P-type ATPase [Massilia sp. CF038]|uniref:heavy metal translocating P-type ATPase n=1 Tax=Massilia sp. CF038 TaxID=1881045 RepID=UPI00091C7BE2|nr:heavy metal translocating P-type ATPase [Massilia sp. CF038]SHH01327.1 Cu2+-exporting ATPase [Massilia sp. CF038]